MRGRFMTWQEKARGAGIVPSSLAGLPLPAVETALGNTILVALVGSVVIPVLRAWAIASSRRL